jgi:hypothetical protein
MLLEHNRVREVRMAGWLIGTFGPLPDPSPEGQGGGGYQDLYLLRDGRIAGSRGAARAIEDLPLGPSGTLRRSLDGIDHLFLSNYQFLSLEIVAPWLQALWKRLTGAEGAIQ